jgi:hypothetical protein
MIGSVRPEVPLRVTLPGPLAIGRKLDQQSYTP